MELTTSDRTSIQRQKPQAVFCSFYIRASIHSSSRLLPVFHTCSLSLWTGNSQQNETNSRWTRLSLIFATCFFRDYYKSQITRVVRIKGQTRLNTRHSEREKREKGEKKRERRGGEERGWKGPHDWKGSPRGNRVKDIVEIHSVWYTTQSEAVRGIDRHRREHRGGIAALERITRSGAFTESVSLNNGGRDEKRGTGGGWERRGAIFRP